MLYLHIPYCHRKCTYCAFYSSVGSQGMERYVEALCKELRQRRDYLGHSHLRTIYFGGGTPSMLPISLLGKIVDTIGQQFDITDLEEVTLECNPEDLTPEYLHALKNLGIFNRLSIGIQSLLDDELRLLNRRHNAATAVTALHNAAAAGFDNLSIDLIYGIPKSPNASYNSWSDNLEQVKTLMQTLPIKHLSAYALTVEEGTMLHRQIAEGRLAPIDEEMQVECYQQLLQWCPQQGLEQYEISNFALPGYHARHNSRYWDRTPYLGVGAAAHSFDGQRRRWNVADAQAYTESTLSAYTDHEEEELGLKEAHNEYLMTALRTTQGIEKAKIAAPFSARLERDIDRYKTCGWIVETATHYRPTSEGLLHADGMAAALFV